MARITGEIEIQRPLDVVFDFVADERNEPKYNPDMLRSEKVTAGPIGVGTRFSAVHKSRRGPVEMTIEVTDFDRPYRMAETTTMAWGDIRGQVMFTPSDNGTRMSWEWDVRPRKLGALFGPLVGLVGRRRERAVSAELKRYLES